MRYSQAAMSIRNLTKRYDDGTLALDDLELEIPAGRSSCSSAGGS